MLRQRSAQVGVVLIGLLIVTAVFASVIAPYEPNVAVGINEGAQPRRARPVLAPRRLPGGSSRSTSSGVDRNGRDVFTRVLYGSRLSLQIGFLTVGFAIFIGTLIGAAAGYAGGWVDNVLMRIMDVVLAFPALVLAIAIVTVLGVGILNAQLAIGIVAIPVYARVMRASVLSIRERDYVTASRALGESGRGILWRRIVPNALTPLIVQGTLGIAGAVLEVAALSFLGLGAQPPLPEWGSMIAPRAQPDLQRAATSSSSPGIALSLTVLGFNLLGDGLRDALDPRLNR